MLWFFYALLSVLAILLVAPLRLQAMAFLNPDHVGQRLTVEVRWAWWRIWRLQPVTDASPAPIEEPRSKPKSRKSRSTVAWDNLREVWQLVRKYWRAAFRLLHLHLVGNVQLELADAAITAWLFAATCAIDWPPPTLRLELPFGQQIGSQGRLG